MNQKTNILLFDIDGTLLGDRTCIPKSCVSAIHQARREGCLAFINTGRARGLVPDSIVNIGFDGLFCGCGSYTEIAGKILENALLTEEQLERIRRTVAPMKAFVAYEGPEHVYYRIGDNPELQKRVEEDWSRDEALMNSKPDEPGLLRVNKFSIYTQHPEEIRRLEEEVADFAYGIQHSSDFVEFVLKGHSKAKPLQELRDRYPQATLYAFGDGKNDIPMIDLADVGICMGDGNHALKERADYVTTALREEGIKNALLHFHLLSED